MFRYVIVLLVATCVFGLPQRQGFGSMENRIVNGQEAVPGQFPYQVFLERREYNYCGGAIVSNRWIVTIAQCSVGMPPEYLSAVVGTVTFNEGGDRYSIDRIVIHPEYNDEEKNHTNDIALLHTTTEIIFSDLVQPIPIADYEVPIVDEVIVTGWGLHNSDVGLTPAKTLQQVTLGTLTIGECKFLVLFLGLKINDRQICTLSVSGRAACSGDHGGPVVHNGNLVGLVSYAFSCGDIYPDIHTRTAAYREWVLDTIQ